MNESDGENDRGGGGKGDRGKIRERDRVMGTDKVERETVRWKQIRTEVETERQTGGEARATDR